ncbi:DUF6152 family protein [Cocleimonas flava]|uniref:DUF5666 domain-containing protein n=1 Tax=Cocleimonas flava TaxID=634765 RepID=A0A4R1EX14_9GAMM|nr:DUF6152 family protein [Cocleimonas flava]TCJ84542.1 hypothetical protein EV695_2499 [Cocleimonas flava]
MNRWLLTLSIFLLSFTTALAHHGWRWTSDTNVEVIGVIESATLGNPHGVLILDVEGQKWTAEVGQPWRNQRAGLKDEMMSKGTEITIDGQRSADPKELRVKAERIVIDGKRYVLYPERN